ncbi:hypothetical protein PSYAR_11654 [Pseudomonas syringae pv. aceris str. M302273]|nr:hypothetical protein PSYAR_11654 [Pseudomonas syringae pv. aceris str. M302273]
MAVLNPLMALLDDLKVETVHWMGAFHLSILIAKTLTSE